MYYAGLKNTEDGKLSNYVQKKLKILVALTIKLTLVFHEMCISLYRQYRIL